MTKHPRTYLFVPGNRPERFDKAILSSADAIVVDLEDAVAPAAKGEARERVREWLARTPEADLDRLVVRVNDEHTAWFAADAAMLRECGVRQAMLPKAETAQGISRLRAAAGEQLAVLALIETARGVRDVDAVAGAQGVSRLAFGTIDYAVDLDLSGSEEGFTYAAGRIAIASRASGLPPPVAGVTTEIDDAERVRADMQLARAHGFGAKLCIHPRQVAMVHEALGPSQEQADWARRVLAAAEAAAGAAVQVDGKMVDRPVLERARLILQRAAG